MKEKIFDLIQKNKIISLAVLFAVVGFMTSEIISEVRTGHSLFDTILKDEDKDIEAQVQMKLIDALEKKGDLPDQMNNKFTALEKELNEDVKKLKKMQASFNSDGHHGIINEAVRVGMKLTRTPEENEFSVNTTVSDEFVMTQDVPFPNASDNYDPFKRGINEMYKIIQFYDWKSTHDDKYEMLADPVLNLKQALKELKSALQLKKNQSKKVMESNLFPFSVLIIWAIIFIVIVLTTKIQQRRRNSK
ncbi:MAG: hypothetical protein K9M56_04205 [Victivallales bacterium]|nr:hypothetical protein [Victivallales bacterium]